MDKSIAPVNQIVVRSSTGYEFSNPNPSEVVEIEDDPLEVVERKLENLKLNHQFNENDVPKIFKTLINGKLENRENIGLLINSQYCTMIFDDIEIHVEKNEDDWLMSYENTGETIKTNDPEKSIIDHLWFVLKNPNVKLSSLNMTTFKESQLEPLSHDRNSEKMSSEKLNTLLQSMLDSINHQFQIKYLECYKFNEDSFFSLLKHIESGTLEFISLDISWKENGNYEKMKEIMETDQWKKTKKIFSRGLPPLKVEDLLHCEIFWLKLNYVTPEDVLRASEHILNSVSGWCVLNSRILMVDIDAITDALRSRNDGAEITETQTILPADHFRYQIVKLGKRIFLNGNHNYVGMEKK